MLSAPAKKWWLLSSPSQPKTPTTTSSSSSWITASKRGGGSLLEAERLRRPERVLLSPRTFYCDRRVLEGGREELEKRRRRDCIPGHTGEKTIHSKTFNTFKFFSYISTCEKLLFDPFA